MADPYRSPSPSGGGAHDPAGAQLSLHVAPVHPAVRPDSEATTHAVITIRAENQAPGARRPALSAVLVLDVSGSMQGEPIAQVLHSARRLAEVLDDTDRLGVVTFSNGAETVAPLAPLATGRRDLLAKLAEVSAGGGTNIAGGLAQAALMFSAR
jgi:Ca-activated chloride channel homolog